MNAASALKKTKNTVASKRSWYTDYLNHETAQYRMSFIEYKKLRREKKIK
jgi:hypothetical protein